MGLGQSSTAADSGVTKVPLCSEGPDGARDASPSRSSASACGVVQKCAGLKNYDNSCFINATIQLLFHCDAFRSVVCSPSDAEENPTLLRVLRELFDSLTTCGKSALSPKAFVAKAREEFGFPKGIHQDAHEFLSRLLNSIIDTQRRGVSDEREKCPLQRVVQGTLFSEFACIDCESSTSRTESFPFLSLEIEQNASLVGCLAKFFAAELLCGNDKFRCECCCTSVCARKTFDICEAPQLLFVQLKRFHYSPETGSHRKLAYRVTIPHKLGIPYSDRGNCQGMASYRLKGFVVHHGASLSYGHYYACIRCGDGHWRCFDDDKVSEMSERDVVRYFGAPQQQQLPSNANSATAYLVLYERSAD